MRRGVDCREARLEGSSDVGGVIDRKRGLGDKGEPFRVTDLEAGNIGDGFDQQHLTRRQLAHGADRLGVAVVADVDHLGASLMVAGGLVMDLGHEGAGGIDGDHLAGGGLRRDGFRDAVGRKDDGAVGGAIVQLFDKDRALGLQGVNDEFVVDDLVPDIDRRAPFLDRKLDDLDGAVDAGAKAARGGEVEGEGGQVRHCKVRGWSGVRGKTLGRRRPVWSAGRSSARTGFIAGAAQRPDRVDKRRDQPSAAAVTSANTT